MWWGCRRCATRRLRGWVSSVPSSYHRAGLLTPEARTVLAALDGTLEEAALAERFGPDTATRLAWLRRERYLLSDERATRRSS